MNPPGVRARRRRVRRSDAARAALICLILWSVDEVEAGGDVVTRVRLRAGFRRVRLGFDISSRALDGAEIGTVGDTVRVISDCIKGWDETHARGLPQEDEKEGNGRILLGLPYAQTHPRDTTTDREQSTDSQRLTRHTPSPKRPSRHSEKRRRSSSPSSSSSSSSRSRSRSVSSSSSDDRRSKKKRKHSKHKKEKKKKDRKEKKKKGKKKEKRKKEKKKGKEGGLTGQWGKYGILTSADMYRKEAEFRTWLMEVKHISPEVLPNSAMKTYFAEYAEDFNTGTLPHQKYYDLDSWERDNRTRERAEAEPDDGSFVDIMNDEEHLRRQSKAMRSGRAMELGYSKEQLAELKKVSEERIAADRLRKMGYQPKESMGVRYEEG
ncbi:hypothetical protein HK104_003934 [Borealophlyctis nickersoniae]|nr:hypothetical protein HK104_003934 [Borealophlyctis nickersoniae]